MCVFLASLTTLLAGSRQLSAATFTVCASGCAFADFQVALNTAEPGDTILLRAGETFVGNFVLPAKGGSGASILIRSDAPDGALPPDGTRLVPNGYSGGNTDLTSLARLRGTGGQWKTTPVLQSAPGAHDYKLQFLDIDGIAQEGWYTLVEIGGNADDQATMDQVPRNIVLDRVFIHGHPIKGQQRCLGLNGSAVDVLNSYIASCTSFVFDAQAIAGFNGPGPFRIDNNYVEASGENILFGGADPRISGLIPSDIRVTRNYITKPLAWMSPVLPAPTGVASSALGSGGSLGAGSYYVKVVAMIEVATDYASSPASEERPVFVGSNGGALSVRWDAVAGADFYRVYIGDTPGGQNRFMETSGSATSFTYTGAGESWQSPPAAGTRWSVNNLLELKNAQRVLIDGNIFDHVWQAAQKGYAIVLTPRNQDGNAPWAVVRDVTFSNNVLRHAAGGINVLGEDDIRSSQHTERITIRNNLVYDVSHQWGDSAHFLLLTRAPSAVTVDHNSIFHEGMVVLVDDGAASGFTFTNNVARHNDYGVFGSGAGVGNAALAAYFPGVVFRRNALGGGPAAQYPADNFFPDLGTFNTQFVNAAAEDFHLVPGSAFSGAGTEGRDLGVDFGALSAAMQGMSGGDGSGPGGVPGDNGGGSGGSGGTGGTGGATPFGGGAVQLPGLIEAENFDQGASGVAYADSTPGNSGGQYRTSDVDVEIASDAGGGYDVGWAFAGEWLKYSVTVATAGTYDIEARVASSGPGGTFHIEVNGVDKTGPLTIPNTGGWQAWDSVRAIGVPLAAGPQVWQLVMDSDGSSSAVGNFNFLRVVPSGGTSSTPLGGTPGALPGTIEAENFDEGGEGTAFHDFTASNEGGQYRNTGVDIEVTSDAGGGYNIGWAFAGEWFDYTVNVAAAGTYEIQARVASLGSGGIFHIEVNGADVTGPISIPDTRAWQSWTDVRIPGVSLGAGVQRWRLVLDSNGESGAVGNFNWLRVQ